MPFYRNHAEKFQRLPGCGGVDQLMLGIVGNKGVGAGTNRELLVI